MKINENSKDSNISLEMYAFIDEIMRETRKQLMSNHIKSGIRRRKAKNAEMCNICSI